MTVATLKPSPEDDNYGIAVGKRTFTDGSKPGYQQHPVETAIAVVTLALYTSWPYILFILLLFTWFPPVFLINLLLFSTLFMPAQLCWEDFLNMDVFRTWREYFNFSFKFEEKLNHKDRKFLFAEFPHGTYPMGPLLAGTMIPHMFPGQKVYSVAASVLFRMPLLRHFMTWLGSQPADKKHFQALMERGNVAVVVGGIAEMFMQYEDREQVMLSSRKGFIKMALVNGHDVVPVYHFGNTRLLSIGPKSLMDFCRKIRTSVGILIGRWGLPIPRQHPIYMVVGRAVRVEKPVKPDDPNFEEAVNELHGRVQKELIRIYDDNKAEFGWENRPLQVV